MCEEGEESTSKRSDKRIDRNSAVGVEPIAVDKVTHTLPKRDHTAESEQSDRKDLRHPCNVGVARPSEPEETSRKSNSSDNHGWETLLGNYLAVLAVCASEVCSGAVCDAGCAHEDPDYKGTEGQLRNAEGPAAFFIEGHGKLWVEFEFHVKYGVSGMGTYGFEEEVDYAVEKTHVGCNECQDRFLGEHDKRS